ncbi:hypothetical protein N7462_010072 [Penicillium macrosclerotiorum]|uniref:uncharacterized protein n=1 Tax=Penicillium macrosclerotiorum TaxID=303699 RepID=UPI0025473828|nr:uncharacterized protein N7462_010072 [Penicillium macrosclerotiorum]KAJ5669002.1 hypothetical protein N7462_010072 [Penicillium macrosclerotiorum]
MPRIYLFTKLAIFGFLAAALFLALHHVNKLHEESSRREEEKVETYNLQSTSAEHRCLYNSGPASTPIPKIVHLIWLENAEINFMAYLTIRSALVSIQPDIINLHYTVLNHKNEWLKKLRDNITLVQHDLAQEYSRQMDEKWKITHISDLLRLDVINREGGIYVDMDVILLRHFDNLLQSPKDLILGNEGGDRHGLCNAIILGRPGSSFVQRWRESYRTFSRHEWNYHSVTLPKELSTQYTDEICSLSPAVFFWPSWTKRHIEYMHKPISDNETREFETTIADNRGAIFPTQLAYHAWSQVAAKYLRNLSIERVMSENTRFNILVRRFLE